MFRVLFLMFAGMALILTSTAFGQTKPGPSPAIPSPTPPPNPNFFIPNGLTPDGKPPQTPLEHLAFDVKLTSLPVGDKRGDTSGGQVWIAHRFIDSWGGMGYGWIKRINAPWKEAVWACLRETPGTIIAPHRRLLKPQMDANWEYKIWGQFEHDKAYDARTDEFLPVFDLAGYQVLGPAAPLDLKVGTPGRQ